MAMGCAAPGRMLVGWIIEAMEAAATDARGPETGLNRKAAASPSMAILAPSRQRLRRSEAYRLPLRETQGIRMKRPIQPNILCFFSPGPASARETRMASGFAPKEAGQGRFPALTALPKAFNDLAECCAQTTSRRPTEPDFRVPHHNASPGRGSGRGRQGRLPGAFPCLPVHACLRQCVQRLRSDRRRAIVMRC